MTMVMNKQRWMLPLGMAAVLSFLLLTSLGFALWPGYNPIRSYVSVLFSEQSPHVHLMRFFLNTYTICFCVYSLVAVVHAYRAYHLCCKIGFTLLFLLAFLSVLGYGAVPVGMEVVLAPNDLFHLAFTITLLVSTIVALVLISIGLIKQEQFHKLGRIAAITTTLYIVFNIWHLAAILTGQNILGLLQRLTFYSFHVFTFSCSWVYTLKQGPYYAAANGKDLGERLVFDKDDKFAEE